MIKPKQQRFNGLWLTVAIVSLALLMILSHWPQETMPVDINRFGLDKIAHAAVYAGLAWLFLKGIPPGRTYVGWFGVVGGLVCIAVLDEMTQPFFNRQFDLFDILADAIGIIGCFLIMYFKCEQSRRVENTDLPAKEPSCGIT